ncbi:MAG: DUF1573 domain-containing protein [Planctomycetaceae bacterium]|nr:DUF1573 domain-containing protein [Planctomycetaceae bacterium]
MRTIISIIVSALIIGGVFGYIAGDRLANEYPYSLEQEKEYLAKKAANRSDEPEPEDQPVMDSTKPHPTVAIDLETYDFGVFEKEQTGEHTFTIRNTGDSSLTLEVLNKSCSCTSVDLSRRSVPPSQDARVTMKWKPNNAGGSYRQGVEIGTNDPARPRFQLFVEGVYSVPIIAQPNPVQINAFSGQEASNQTRIYFFDKEKEVAIREITSDDPEHFAATFVKSELTEENLKVNLLKSAKAVYDVTVTLKPGMQIGHFKNKLIVRSDSDLEPEMTIPVNGQVLGSLAITSRDYNEKTGVLDLGTAFRGTPVQKQLLLRFKAPDDVTPEFKVESKNPEWLNVTLGSLIAAQEGNNIQQVTIEIPADANLGASDVNDADNPSAIVLESNIPAIATIRIPVEYVVQEPVTSGQ